MSRLLKDSRLSAILSWEQESWQIRRFPDMIAINDGKVMIYLDDLIESHRVSNFAVLIALDAISIRRHIAISPTWSSLID